MCLHLICNTLVSLRDRLSTFKVMHRLTNPSTREISTLQIISEYTQITENPCYIFCCFLKDMVKNMLYLLLSIYHSVLVLRCQTLVLCSEAQVSFCSMDSTDSGECQWVEEGYILEGSYFHLWALQDAPQLQPHSSGAACFCFIKSHWDFSSYSLYLLFKIYLFFSSVFSLYINA